jgi:hypothetical protein
MAVEIRVFLAVAAFRQKPGTVLAAAWMLFRLPAKQVLDSKCKAFGIGFSDADLDCRGNNRSRRKARFLAAIIARISVAANS